MNTRLSRRFYGSRWIRLVMKNLKQAKIGQINKFIILYINYYYFYINKLKNLLSPDEKVSELDSEPVKKERESLENKPANLNMRLQQSTKSGKKLSIKFSMNLNIQTFIPLKFKKQEECDVDTRDTLSHVSQWSDSQQNQGVSQISLLFQILMILFTFKNIEYCRC